MMLPFPTNRLVLDYSVFNITLEDHLGQDRHLVQEIDVIVSFPPRYGQLNNHVRGARNITTFKLVELEQGEIEYQFANQTDNDSFSWIFQYGSSSVGPFQLQISVPEINVHVGTALVEFGGVVNLNSSHLLARDDCGGMNDSLVYHILVFPQYGSLINQHAFNSMNTTLISFTQADLNNHQILYQSMRSDTHSSMQDQFIFIVCNAYRCSEAKIFVINIYHYNIMVVNTGFEVEEGSVHHITINELNILAPRDSIGLRFFIEQQPKHGNITLKTDIRVMINVQFFDLADVVSGSILYENDGSEFLHDSFQFTATAQYHNKVTENYETLLESDMVNITILPVNDNSPVIVRPLESYDVLKGGSTNIPGSLLQAHDPDSDIRDEDIVWQLQLGSPYNGYMYLDVDQGRMHSISTWTEGDLRKNRLYYRNDRAPPSGIDILFYTISDGFFTSDGDQRIILNVQKFIFESTATVNLLSTGAVLQIANHTPDPPVMTSNTQVDSTPLPSHAMGETALPRSLAQTRSAAILVGTMVPVVVIIASLVLLTSCATVIILRHHHHEDYPENDHIYDYPDIQLPPVLPVLQNKLECATVADLDSPQIVNRQKMIVDVLVAQIWTRAVHIMIVWTKVVMAHL